MAEARDQLLSRKRDIYAALRALEQDRSDGAVDAEAYGRARERFEREAAEILERLDGLPTDQEGLGGSGGSALGPTPTGRTPTGKSPMSRLVPLGAACLAAAALGVFLISSLHPRAANGSVTGDQAAGLPNSAAPSAQLLAAQAAVRAHPRGPDAYIALGNAYFASGLIAAADDSYQTALQLDPRRPEAPTLHAMMLGSLGRGAQARAVLGQVERAHPGYARAWLLDGLISSGQHQYGQAIAAWRRFLALSPRSALTVQVRKLIAGAERAQRSGK